MKRRMNIMLVAILVMLGALIALSVRGQKTTIVSVAASDTGSVAPGLPNPVQQLQPTVQVTPKPAPVAVEQAPASVPATPAGPAPIAAPSPIVAPTPQAELPKSVTYGAGEKLGYKAVAGDNLPDVVVGLQGSDTKKNRDAVIAENPSLKANPDRILTGKTYVVTAPDAAGLTPAVGEIPSANIPAIQPEASNPAQPKSDRVLRYTAQPGDSVSGLAAGLLGADSKINRDAIINKNQSLQDDPYHLAVGKTYKIPTTDGLSAAPAPAAAISPAPTTQPDADGVVQIGTGRELRYTARAGDTVSKLAHVLLGSDTPAHRDAIINNNASLKADPDRVVAGQTYWIPAPVASVEQ